MSAVLFDLGRFCFRHAKAVLGVWIIALILLGAGAGLLQQGTTEEFTVPGSSGQEALDDLSGRFPELSGATGQAIVIVPEGQDASDEATRTAVAGLVDRLESVPGVGEVTDPYGEEVDDAISSDGRAVLVTAQLEENTNDLEQRTLDGLLASVEPLRDAGYVAEVGGGAFVAEPPEISIMELFGLVVAFVVLYTMFRAVRAAFLPLLSALAGAGATMALIFLATGIVQVPGTAPLLALMISIAVGIDYALFILSRHRDQMVDGVEAEESTAVSIATAGGAIVFAGLTTLIALLGLTLAGLPFLSVMGVSAAGGVAIAVVSAVTFLPALMGLMGDRLAPKAVRAARAAAAHESDEDPEDHESHESLGEGDEDGGGEHREDAAGAGSDEPSSGRRERGTSDDGEETQDGDRDGDRHVEEPRASWGLTWVRVVTWQPLLTVVLVTAALVGMAVPATDLRLALPDNGGMPETSSPRRAYDLVGEHFGPGANGPLLVTIDIIDADDPLGLVEDVEAEIAAVAGIDRIQIATPNPSVDTGVVIAIPETGPMDDATAALIRDLRDRLPAWEAEYGTTLAVTGQTAIQIDVSDRLGQATLPFALVVLGFALLLLMVMFRSIVVPVTATLGFVLSTVAAFGVVAVVYEYGWFAGPLGVDRTGPIISFLPIILMGVMFGLAMDYQVFLVTRMREAYVRGTKAREAVIEGFVSSSTVVLAAAAIMIAVFAAFVPGGDMNLQPIALGLTLGVFFDALIVRMVLIPSVLSLFGERTWWFPAVLERLLPRVDVEGDVIHEHLERSRVAPEHPERVVEVRDLTVSGARGPVVTGLDLHVDSGGLCVVQGPDGSGKTSVLLTIAGRMPFDEGWVEVEGYALPGMSGAVQRRVALAEFAGINDLDPTLTLGAHVAERLATTSLMPWARSRDVQAVLDRFADALAVAAEHGPDVAIRPELRRDVIVDELVGLERVLFGVCLALVADPRVVVVDETAEVRAGADVRAVLAAVGYLIRSAPAPVAVVTASTEDVREDVLAAFTGLPREHLEVVRLAPTLDPADHAVAGHDSKAMI